MMKVWLAADVLLAKSVGNRYSKELERGSAKTLHAGTCLIVCEDQTLANAGELAVHGEGCCDILNVEWLTFDPTHQLK